MYVLLSAAMQPAWDIFVIWLLVGFFVCNLVAAIAAGVGFVCEALDWERAGFVAYTIAYLFFGVHAWIVIGIAIVVFAVLTAPPAPPL